MDYDLEVYTECSSEPIATSAQRFPDLDEWVVVGGTTRGGFFNVSKGAILGYFVRVKFVSGSSCQDYTLYFDGHDC